MAIPVLCPPQVEQMNELQQAFYKNLKEQPDVPMAVLAIKALTDVIQASTETTVMGLRDEIKSASNQLIDVGGKTLSLSSACDLFARFVTRTSLDVPDFTECKARIVLRGNSFEHKARASRQRIAELGRSFIRDGSVVLTHSYSRVVLAMLLAAHKQNKRFSVIVTEARPEGLGHSLADALHREGIPVTLVLDAAVGKVLEKADFVLVGAEGVVESGGVINKIGTFSAAIAAKAFNRPFYVASESFKFSRMYPLDQSDYPVTSFDLIESRSTTEHSLVSSAFILDAEAAAAAAAADAAGERLGSVPVHVESVDFTPPEYISLLITDLGVLTPSAVSDELIKLYL